MRYYPIFLDVRGRRAVVVGGGKVAERKVRKLLRAGAVVRVISPELTPGLDRLAGANRIRVTRRQYQEGELARQRANRLSPQLVLAATDDPTGPATVELVQPTPSINRDDDISACTPKPGRLSCREQ